MSKFKADKSNVTLLEQFREKDPYFFSNINGAINALARNGIHTVGQVCEMSEVDLIKIPGIGRKKLRVTIDLLSDLGLRHLIKSSKAEWDQYKRDA